MCMYLPTQYNKAVVFPTHHSGPESAKYEQNYLGYVNGHQIHQNRGFRGWGFQIWGQNLISHARFTRTCTQIVKFLEKCMLYVYSRVFWVKDFKSAVKIANFRACTPRALRACLKTKEIVWIMHVVCLFQGFMGQGFQIFSQNCNFLKKDIVREKNCIAILSQFTLSEVEDLWNLLVDLSPSSLWPYFFWLMLWPLWMLWLMLWSIVLFSLDECKKITYILISNHCLHGQIATDDTFNRNHSLFQICFMFYLVFRYSCLFLILSQMSVF